MFGKSSICKNCKEVSEKCTDASVFLGNKMWDI